MVVIMRNDGTGRTAPVSERTAKVLADHGWSRATEANDDATVDSLDDLTPEQVAELTDLALNGPPDTDGT